MIIFRLLSPADIEKILGSWASGKDSDIIILVGIVVGLSPVQFAIDFTLDMKLNYVLDTFNFTPEKDGKMTLFFYLFFTMKYNMIIVKL